MNYNLLYGAWSGYGDERRGLPLGPVEEQERDGPVSCRCRAGGRRPAIYFFNPANPGWQDYLIGQEAKVFAAYPFDGWHVDQVGDRRRDRSTTPPEMPWTSGRRSGPS